MTKGGAWAAWRERIRRYERSGLTVMRFCEQEGVSAPRAIVSADNSLISRLTADDLQWLLS